MEHRVLLTMPAYVLQIGSANPMDGQGTGVDYYESHPVLVDLDGDLDLDLVVGRANGISYFENIGDVLTPIFVERIGAQNPFSSLDAVLAGATPAPALADWDADGDLDLLWATFAGLTAYENVGSASAASFSPLGPGNPFDGLYTSIALSPVPSFGDIDGDGDLDLVVSRASSQMAYFRNVGSPTTPNYVATTVGNPFSSVVLGVFGSPSLGDVDGDGDVDLVTGSLPVSLTPPATMKFFENTGSAASPNLTSVSGVFNDPLSALGIRAAPALGDLNGDGLQDLLIAVDYNEASGLPGFRYYQAESSPVLLAPVNSVPGFQLTREDVVIVFSVANGNAISVADPNADGSDLQVTLSVAQGNLTLATTAGLSFSFSDSQGTGTGTGFNNATMTFRGTLSKINAALNGLKFTPAIDFSGNVTLSITTNDLGQPGGGPALSDTDSVPITVLSVSTQAEQLQLEITLLVEFNGLKPGPANALQRLLNLSGDPIADAVRIRAFMNVVRAFGRADILPDESDVFLLERAQDILVGITTHV